MTEPRPSEATQAEVEQIAHTVVPTTNVGVHATHCCIRHWCKYGDDDCPVMDGTVEGIPTEACEMCDHDREIATELPSDVLAAEIRRRGGYVIQAPPVTAMPDGSPPRD